MSTPNPFAQHASLRRLQDALEAETGRPWTLAEARELMDRVEAELARPQRSALRVV